MKHLNDIKAQFKNSDFKRGPTCSQSDSFRMKFANLLVGGKSFQTPLKFYSISVIVNKEIFLLCFKRFGCIRQTTENDFVVYC